MPNYQLGKIYKIVSNVTGDVYIGSTTKKYLSERLKDHKYEYKRYLNGERGYITSFKIIESGDYDIILLENCPCETKDQLHARERFHIENNECINRYIPGRTRKQYREENRDKIRQHQGEVIKCPLCNGNITRRNLATHKQTLKCQNARQI